MHRIDAILENYERDLQKATEGQCKKISRCTEFRESFKKEYHETYAHTLAELTRKLAAKGHQAEVRERSAEALHYGFALFLIPRHLLSPPVDRFHPLHLRSSIAFVANEHTLSIDVESEVNPNVEKGEKSSIEKIPRSQFNEELMLRKIGEFLERVFNQTILLDFRQA